MLFLYSYGLDSEEVSICKYSMFQKVTVLTLIEEIELESLPEFLSEIEDVTVTPHSDNIQVR